MISQLLSRKFFEKIEIACAFGYFMAIKSKGTPKISLAFSIFILAVGERGSLGRRPKFSGEF